MTDVFFLSECTSAAAVQTLPGIWPGSATSVYEQMQNDHIKRIPCTIDTAAMARLEEGLLQARHIPLN